MSIDNGDSWRVLWLAAALQAASLAYASTQVRPSDCRPRDADSTCATAVAAAPAPSSPFSDRDVLYDGPLGGVPATGYAYWGWDFVAEATGQPSPVRPDLFINRSKVPVTITFSFNIPTSHPCAKDCLPGMQFQVEASWYKLDPPFMITGDVASASETFAPGKGYGFVIALWQSSNARLTVTVPKGSAATLEEVGLPTQPDVAREIPAVVVTCNCSDGTRAACSDGTRYSNGLLGAWLQSNEFYMRAGAFSDCPTGF